MPDQDDPGELKKLIIRDLQLETDEGALTAGTVEAFKEKLIIALNTFLEPIRARRADYDDDKKLMEILAEGTKKAGKVADEVMGRVNEAMKLVKVS